jgi:3-hydroxybutyryl-CoA dehydrogenase
MEIKKVGVAGCGTMGSGIVQVCAQSGYEVVVTEVSDDLLNRGLASIDAVLTRNVARERISQQDKDAALGRIKGSASNRDFADCDLVIEAAIENLDLKKKIFAELDKICPEQAILATNTSCLSIIEVATQTSRPDKVLGLHFFNPVPVMKLLEIVKTIATSDETLETGKEFARTLDKTVVVAQDVPGFIVNRLLVPFLLDAIRTLEANLATREDIDTGISLGLNHPIGPLAVADLIGLDTLYFIAGSIYDELKDPRYASPSLLKKMVTVGWLGRKTGKGFYEYS